MFHGCLIKPLPWGECSLRIQNKPSHVNHYHINACILKSIFSRMVTINKHQISPLIDNLKKPSSASRQDGLVLTILW